MHNRPVPTDRPCQAEYGQFLLIPLRWTYPLAYLISHMNLPDFIWYWLGIWTVFGQLMGCMHTLNALSLLIDTGLNSLVSISWAESLPAQGSTLLDRCIHSDVHLCVLTMRFPISCSSRSHGSGSHISYSGAARTFCFSGWSMLADSHGNYQLTLGK